MVFSGNFFIFVFLPLALGIYFLCPKSGRNLALFLISLLFYAWGEPVYVWLMIFSAVVDYTHGLLIHHYRHEKNLKKLFLFSSVLINVGLLGVFKYSGFLVSNLNLLLNLNIPVPELTLPIGISFYTFQTMSYTIDVYRGLVPPQRNFINFGAYVSLFPQLIAGPIVRYQSIADDLEHRTHSLELFAQGVSRFCFGLAKKVLLANNLGLLFTNITSYGELSPLGAWLGIIAFSLQIYFDFSGYSDMAIGLGKMFGFNFPENFNYPYISTSITEFWRRWHISLGTWFREYVYIPLGGNRVGQVKLLRNLLVVWGLTGFWHGASWNFILWGLFFGIILIIEKAFLLKFLAKLPRFLAHGYALFLVALSWVLFTFESLGEGLNYLGQMFGGSGSPEIFWYYLTSNCLLLIVAVIAATPIGAKIPENRWTLTLKPLVLGVLLVMSVAYLVDSTYNPFLYFRF